LTLWQPLLHLSLPAVIEVLHLPVLEASAFDALHEKSVSFFQRDVLGFGDQILVDSFLDLSQPQIECASAYLGYPQKSTSKKKPAEAPV
jgi:hypothetical protein